MSTCIIWAGSKDRDGYGTVSLAGKKYQAHRVAYSKHYGIDIQGSVIRHTCDNPPCVNPEHLIIGTHQDNMRDMVSRGRQRKAKGEQNSKAKLTAADVKHIRRLIANGEMLKDIAKNYGVRTTTITAIKTGQNWGWLA